MKPALTPHFPLTRHARERMAQRNLSPELLDVIKTYGSPVRDGILMLRESVAEAIEPLEERVRTLKREIAAHCRNRGHRRPCKPSILAKQEEVAILRGQIEEIRKTEGFLICTGDDCAIVTVQRANPRKLRCALRGMGGRRQRRQRQIDRRPRGWKATSKRWRNAR